MSTCSRVNGARAAASLSTLALATFAVPAQAHHPMGGSTRANAWEGLLSGLGHPIIEFEHLVFLLAVAALLALTPSLRGRAVGVLLAAMVAASGIGTLLHIAGVSMPFEPMVMAATLVCAAIGLLWPALRQARWVVPFCLVAAVVHGHAYGEAISGAAGSAMSAYLFGLAVMQSALVGGGWRFGQRLRRRATR